MVEQFEFECLTTDEEDYVREEGVDNEFGNCNPDYCPPDCYPNGRCRPHG